MKALVLTDYGGNEKLKIAEVPLPQGPGPSQVKIAAKFAGLNPLDYKIRGGKLKAIRKLVFPHIMGNEVAGVVTEVGSQVKQFKVGDEVYARLHKGLMGAFA